MTTTTTAVAVQTGNALTIQAPDLTKALRLANGTLAMAKTMTITNDDDLEYVESELKKAAAAAKALEAQRKAVSEPVNKQLKAWNECFKPPSTALKEAEEIMSGLAGAYRLARMKAEQEAAAARERLARIEAERRAAEQRAAEQAAAAQREAERIAAEEAVRTAQAAQAAAAAKLEAETSAAEKLAADGDMQGAAEASQRAAAALKAAEEATASAATIIDKAAAAEEASEEAAALAMVTSVAPAAAPVGARSVAGVSWKPSVGFRVTDIVLLCEFVSKNPPMAHLVTANEVAIGAVVKEFGLNAGLPGVETFEQMKSRVRA